MLAGLDAPTAGEVLLPERGVIGYLGHEPLVYRELTPLENLHLFGRLYRVPERARADRDAARALRALGGARRARLDVFAWNAPAARALPRPPARARASSILDEPFNALDEAGSALLDATLDELRRGARSIVATHDPARVERLATQRLAFA